MLNTKPASINTQQFTWIPFYKELAQNLLPYRSRQKELIAILGRYHQEGLLVPHVKDEAIKGQEIDLQELDPFSFMGIFNRTLKQENRLAICQKIKRDFSINSEIPNDFRGIPTLNNQKSFFFTYQYDRKPDDINALWNIFEVALTDNPLTHPKFDEYFNRALGVKNTGIGTLTMGLFWVNPTKLPTFDSKMRDILDFHPKEANAQVYRQAVDKVYQLNQPIYALSHQAHLNRIESNQDSNFFSTNDNPESQAWVLNGSYHNNIERIDQINDFIQYGYFEDLHDKDYSQLINQMNVGDHVLLVRYGYISSDLPFDNNGHRISCMYIHGRGEITYNYDNGKKVDIDWEAFNEPLIWYFYTTAARPIWKLDNSHELTPLLIDFAFNDKPQNYDFFLKRWDKVFWSKGQEGIDQEEGLNNTLLKPYSEALSLESISNKTGLNLRNLSQWVDQIERKKQAILQGPPGTGKTFITDLLAQYLTKDGGLVELVQFHPSYSYEDFMQGFRPETVNGQLSFTQKDGIFKRFCQRAKELGDTPCVFIIDEINRANLSSVFGELMYLLEYRDKRVKLSSRELFSIPQNVYIIGTMNTADRSIALMDHALRRRFSFITLEPSEAVLRHHLAEVQGIRVSGLIKVLQQISLAMGDPNYALGHSFFVDNPAQLAEHLPAIWQYDIEPYLEEYFYDQLDKVAPFRWNQVKSTILGLDELTNEPVIEAKSNALTHA